VIPFSASVLAAFLRRALPSATVRTTFWPSDADAQKNWCFPRCYRRAISALSDLHNRGTKGLPGQVEIQMSNELEINTSGTLTKDPELTYTPQGKAVTRFSIAINSSYRDGDGNWKTVRRSSSTAWFVRTGRAPDRELHHRRPGDRPGRAGRRQLHRQARRTSWSDPFVGRKSLSTRLQRAFDSRQCR
jgi:hypothetical protein